MKNRNYLLAIATVVAGMPALLGQTAHYPNGVEGLKAASLPPPGFYVRDYNYLYWADDFPDGPNGFDATVYVQAPRLIWISDFKLLGASYGADVLVPFVYQDVAIGTSSWDGFGMGDIFVEPITLSWHGPNYDVAVGYGMWMPTGDFDETDPVSPGKGYWGHMMTAGATLYMDSQKSWAMSVLGRYEINQETDLQHSSGSLTRGDALTVEGGVNKTFAQVLDVGVVGYYQRQLTEDSGSLATSELDEVIGVGPEINWFAPKSLFFLSLRYFYELEAKHRPEGHTLNLTLTKGF